MSGRLTPAAATLTSTSPLPGVGTGRVAGFSTSGPPCSVISMAVMVVGSADIGNTSATVKGAGRLRPGRRAEQPLDLAPQNLSDGAPRQVGHEVDKLGRLDRADPLLGEGDQLLGGGGGARMQQDGGLDPLAPFGVGRREDDAFVDRAV